MCYGSADTNWKIIVDTPIIPDLSLAIQFAVDVKTQPTSRFIYHSDVIPFTVIVTSS